MIKRILLSILKTFAICAMLTATFFAGFSLYMHIHGNRLLQQYISKAFGPQIKFSSISLNLAESSVNFNNIGLSSNMDLSKSLFEAERFIVTFDSEKLMKEKRCIITDILIDGASIHIERDHTGHVNIPSAEVKDQRSPGDAAYPKNKNKGASFYGAIAGVKNITIKNTKLYFKDYFMHKDPIAIEIDQIYLAINTGSPAQNGSIPVSIYIQARVPRQLNGDGFAKLNASMAVYPERVDMESLLESENINLLFFEPYLKAQTPFIVQNGIFSSSTNFNMHNNVIDSLTTVIFRDLRVAVNVNKANGEFLAVSVNKLAPYLTSGGNEIAFDFVVTGPLEKPLMGLGPKVKYAMGMVALEQISSTIQQLQQR